MGIMALDQIRIITVHRPDEITDCLLDERVNPSSKPVRFGHKSQCSIVQRADRLFGNKGLHGGDIHAAIYAGKNAGLKAQIFSKLLRKIVMTMPVKVNDQNEGKC
jgi:hypothetical protein